jgi:hypothetical protein
VKYYLLILSVLAITAVPSITLNAMVSDSNKKDNLPRLIAINLVNPLANFDSNIRLCYTGTQLMGKAADSLNNSFSLDKSFWGRFFQSFFLIYTDAWFRYVSHEMGHDFQFAKKGVPIHIAFRWSYDSGLVHYPFPVLDYVRNYHDYTILNGDEEILVHENGLYLEELNAGFAFKEIVLRNSANFDQAFSYVIPKLMDFIYILYVGIHTEYPEYDIYAHNDIDSYVVLLEKRGIQTSKEKFFYYACAADFLSFATWDSLFAFKDYIIHGKRTYKPTSIIIKNKRILPPNISLFPCPEGYFMNTETYVLSENEVKNRYLLEFGFGTDLLGGDGRMNTLRLGGKYFTHLSCTDTYEIELNPLFYLNTDNNFVYKGYLLGVDIFFPLYKNISISGQVKYGENDVIENLVKGEENRLRVYLGTKIEF